MTASGTHDSTAPVTVAGGLDGLDSGGVAQRVRQGLTNDIPSAPTRSIASIVRANVLTRFNALLGGLLAVSLAVGDLRDALFGLILVATAASASSRNCGRSGRWIVWCC